MNNCDRKHSLLSAKGLVFDVPGLFSGLNLLLKPPSIQFKSMKSSLKLAFLKLANVSHLSLPS